MKNMLVCLSLLLAASPAPVGLIVNGDFEQGNTGFSTQFAYTPGDIGPGGTYDILTNPLNSHGFIPSIPGDHTTGSGLMMAINGSHSTGFVVWSQTVSVAANS